MNSKSLELQDLTPEEAGAIRGRGGWLVELVMGWAGFFLGGGAG